jgi:outer membrane protein assembly factor BamB
VLIRGRSCFLLLVAVVSPSCRSVFGPHEGSDRTLWKAAGVGWGTPAFDATTVYFVAFDHAIIAADKATGHVRWKATTDDQGTSTDGRTAVLTGNIVALGDRDIYGFDRGTGARRWAFHPQDGYLPGIFDLTTDGLTIFAGSPSGRVYAVDGASGASRWITILANDNNTSVFDPTYADGTIYVCIRHFTNPTTGGVAALDAATGTVRWSRNLPAKPPSNSSSCNHHVVVVNADLIVAAAQDGNIYGMTRAAGDIVWTAPQLSNLPSGTGGSPMYDDRPLAVTGTTVIAGSSTGFVTALDGATGRELWRATANRGSATFPLSVDAQRAYVDHLGLQLAAFNISNGSIAWIAEGANEQGEYYPSPAVDTDRLYVGGMHGLYAMKK